METFKYGSILTRTMNKKNLQKIATVCAIAGALTTYALRDKITELHNSFFKQKTNKEYCQELPEVRLEYNGKSFIPELQSRIDCYTGPLDISHSLMCSYDGRLLGNIQVLRQDKKEYWVIKASKDYDSLKNNPYIITFASLKGQDINIMFNERTGITLDSSLIEKDNPLYPKAQIVIDSFISRFKDEIAKESPSIYRQLFFSSVRPFTLDEKIEVERQYELEDSLATIEDQKALQEKVEKYLLQ